MKNYFLLIIGLFFAQICFSQTINIQAGKSLSSIDWEFGEYSLYNKHKIGYSVFAGLDFLDHRYYNLSCNFGLINKGGKDDEVIRDAEGEYVTASELVINMDYVSANTVVNFKYPILNKIIPFFSIGPRLDYLIKYKDDFKGLNEIEKMGELNKLNYGLLIGGGIKYSLSKFQFGLRADYLLNFVKIAKGNSENSNKGLVIKDNTAMFNFMIGYRLK